MLASTMNLYTVRFNTNFIPTNKFYKNSSTKATYILINYFSKKLNLFLII